MEGGKDKSGTGEWRPGRTDRVFCAKEDDRWISKRKDEYDPALEDDFQEDSEDRKHPGTRAG